MRVSRRGKESVGQKDCNRQSSGNLGGFLGMVVKTSAVILVLYLFYCLVPNVEILGLFLVNT